jgi:hypothetical protein
MNLSRPVGQADVGAFFTIACTGLAANRALQLDEPTGGVNARKSVRVNPFRPQRPRAAW